MPAAPRGTDFFEARVFLRLLPGLAGDLRCPLPPAPARLCRCPGTERVWWPAAWQKLSACRERKVLGVSRQEMGPEVMGSGDSVFPSFLPVLKWVPVPVWELKPMVLDGCPSLCLSVCQGLSGAVCLCVAFLSCSLYPGHFCSFPFASVTALFTVSLSLYLSQLFPPHCLPAGSTSLHGGLVVQCWVFPTSCRQAEVLSSIPLDMGNKGRRKIIKLPYCLEPTDKSLRQVE